jgi:hypothetical protein
MNNNSKLGNQAWFLSIFTFIISSIIVLLALLKKFYVSGINFDAPIIANLMWHNGLNIFYPEWITITGTGSYYQSHSSLIFIVTSIFSYLLPLNRIEYTCLVLALSVGLIGYISTLLLYQFRSELKFSNYFTSLIIFVLSLCCVFNVYNINVIYLIHFEIFYISFLLAFLYYFFSKKYYKSYIFLFLFLITREDFGFHLFTLISIILFFNYFLIKDKKLENKKLIIIALIALFSSLLLCYFKSFFPGDKAFQRIYFATSWPEILEILKFENITQGIILFSKNHIHTLVIFLITIIFGIRYRAYPLLISIFSILPWLVLHILAKSESIKSMSDYYDFPFALILIWPTLLYIIFDDKKLNQLRKKIFYLQAIILIFSATVNTVPFFKKIFPVVTIENIKNSNLFAQELPNLNSNNTIVTPNIATLNINLFKKDNIYISQNDVCLSNTIFYYINDVDLYKQATKCVYKYKLKIKNTPIRILTNEDLTQFSNIGANDNFWIEALSLNKNYMYRNYNDSLKLSKTELSSLRKRPIYLYKQKKYCVEIDQNYLTPLLFDIYNFNNNQLIFEENISESSNHFCFTLKDNDTYYLVINPKQKSAVINNFNIVSDK